MGRRSSLTAAAALIVAVLVPAAWGAGDRKLIGSSNEHDPVTLTTDGKTVYFLDFGTVSGTCPDGRRVRERVLPDLQTRIPVAANGLFSATVAVQHDLSGAQRIQVTGRLRDAHRASGTATLSDPACPGLPPVSWRVAPSPPRFTARPRGAYRGLTAEHGTVSFHVSRNGQRLLHLSFGRARVICAHRADDIRTTGTITIPVIPSVRLRRGHADVALQDGGDQTDLEVTLRRGGGADGTIVFYRDDDQGTCNTAGIPWRAHR